MSKIIIDNRSDLNWREAFSYVTYIIEQGRVSDNNQQYCFLTIFTIRDTDYYFSSRRNKKSDNFIITQQKKRDT
jgi:hypothetical protein